MPLKIWRLPVWRLMADICGQCVQIAETVRRAVVSEGLL
jgi:hypothetical protein